VRLFRLSDYATRYIVSLAASATLSLLWPALCILCMSRLHSGEFFDCTDHIVKQDHKVQDIPKPKKQDQDQDQRNQKQEQDRDCKIWS